MNLKKFEEKIHKEIPLTKLMQLNLASLDNEKLLTTAPLDINVNDKGTAFAGSLLTISTISGWSLVSIICKNLEFNPPIIAIVKNTSQFNHPVKNDLKCETYMPNDEEIEKLQNKLQTKGSGSISIKAKIFDNDLCAFEFEGLYVVKL